MMHAFVLRCSIFSHRSWIDYEDGFKVHPGQSSNPFPCALNVTGSLNSFANAQELLDGCALLLLFICINIGQFVVPCYGVMTCLQVSFFPLHHYPQS